MAGLTFTNVFGERGGRGFNIAGPQFDQEATSLKFVAYEHTGVGLETAYTVTTGKTFYISKIMFMNNTTEKTWILKLDDSQIVKVSAGASVTYEIDFPIPIALTSGKTIKTSSDFATSVTTIIGWET